MPDILLLLASLLLMAWGQCLCFVCYPPTLVAAVRGLHVGLHCQRFAHDHLCSLCHAVLLYHSPQPAAAGRCAARRMCAFRRCLVAVVRFLHDDFVEQLGQQAGRTATPAAAPPPPQPPVAAADGAGAPSRDSDNPAADRPAPDATANPHPSVAAAAAAADDADENDLWDPVSRRAWHPAFGSRLAALSRHQLLAAAAELRARRVLLAKMAARRGGRGGGSDGEGWGGWSSGRTEGAALRPPSLLRGHDPCTSCRVLDPVQLLEHLQGLSWYQGQVRGQGMFSVTHLGCGYGGGLSGVDGG